LLDESLRLYTVADVDSEPRFSGHQPIALSTVFFSQLSDSVLDSRQPLLSFRLSSAPPVIPILRFSQLATLIPVIAVGGVAERARFLPILVITFLWATIVYNPVAHWTWSATGWGYVNGVLDVRLVSHTSAFHR
jgi:ammonia channel protein AmtB